MVDHFGDAGFCWRLVKALHDRAIPHVILVIDRTDVLSQLQGDRPPHAVGRGKITVLPWEPTAQRWQAAGVAADEQADVVIEAFACNPPQAYQSDLKPNAQWITLDYLATEAWADDVHLQASPLPGVSHPAAQGRRWFVPGLRSKTGGLMHGQWQHLTKQTRREWRQKILNEKINDDVFLVMAFGYADAPWASFKELLQHHLPPGFKSFRIWQPQGIAVSQDDFDAVLQACDLNFVRGEDSFIRAHWAAAGNWQVPFIWQPYRQTEDSHAEKLLAWLNHFPASPALDAWKEFHWAWNQLSKPGAIQIKSAPLPLNTAWQDLCQSWPATQAALKKSCEALALQTSLEENLIRAVSPISPRR